MPLAIAKAKRTLSAPPDYSPRWVGRESLIVLGNDPYGDPVRTKYAGRIRPEQGMTDAQWQVFTEGANRVARAVKRETGLRTVFHHCNLPVVLSSSDIK
jgi:hypothetical protein